MFEGKWVMPSRKKKTNIEVRFQILKIHVKIFMCMAPEGYPEGL